MILIIVPKKLANENSIFQWNVFHQFLFLFWKETAFRLLHFMHGNCLQPCHIIMTERWDKLFSGAIEFKR